MSVLGGLQIHQNAQHAPILGSTTLLLLCPAEGGPSFTCVVIKINMLQTKHTKSTGEGR